MSQVTPTIEETAALVRLLDDQDSVVHDALKERFSDTTGDLSHQIAALGIDISPADRRLLSQYLGPARRRVLETEWSVPSTGLWEPSDDWDGFEHLLGLISDFLHDGVELRPTLMDQFDLLARDMDRAGVATVNELRLELFVNLTESKSPRFVGNNQSYYDARNSDLCWVLSEGKGNPISLVLVYMLLAHRLGFEIFGCNFPGHFIARVGFGNDSYLVDCFNGGDVLKSSDVLSRFSEKDPQVAEVTQRPASFAEILRRVLHNLCFTFSRSGNKEDAMLLNRLASSLVTEDR